MKTLVIVAAVAAGMLLVGPTAAGGPVGDADCSGVVNSIDAALVLQHTAGLVPSLPCQSEADANEDGDVNAVDATLILQYVAGLVDSLPANDEVLQIHHIDVEQGDAALIISPSGQTAMIDDGRWTNCGNTVSYLQNLNITNIDYHFATHYDADHIGCLDDIGDAGIDVGACYDRGTMHEPTTDTYASYSATCAGMRRTLTRGQVISLGGGATITAVDLNGAGVITSEENALGVVFLLGYGGFDEVFGGDLPGEDPDIESVVGPEVGDVDVATVNHHGSRFSSTDAWLDATQPEVAILSVGNNSFGHPTADAIGRLHAHGVLVYWTNQGSGVAPDPAWDKVSGSIVIEARANGYIVSGAGFADSHPTD